MRCYWQILANIGVDTVENEPSEVRSPWRSKSHEPILASASVALDGARLPSEVGPPSRTASGPEMVSVAPVAEAAGTVAWLIAMFILAPNYDGLFLYLSHSNVVSNFHLSFRKPFSEQFINIIR